jgi:hypothetical protein
MLEQKDLDELKALYKKEFGEDISDDEAFEMGLRLLSLFSVIARPVPKDKDKK